MPFPRKEMQYNGQKKNGKENPTNNVLQTPQTMFYKPHKQCSTNPTNNVLQTTQTMFYKPHKQCSTNPTNNVLQTPQTMFYKPETRIKTEQHEHTKTMRVKSVKTLFILIQQIHEMHTKWSASQLT